MSLPIPDIDHRRAGPTDSARASTIVHAGSQTESD